MLVSLKSEVDGIVKGSSPMKSIFISRSICCKLILVVQKQAVAIHCLSRIQRELIRF
jgi:hypothetical protein